MRSDLTDERRKELIKALQKERDEMNAKFMDIKDHVYALSYLSTGAIRCPQHEIEDFDLLEAAINDTQNLYNDYCS